MISPKLIFEKTTNGHDAIIFIPKLEIEVSIGEKPLKIVLQFKKNVDKAIEIFISIDDQELGNMYFNKRDDFNTLRKIIKEVSELNSTLDSTYNMDDVLWSKTFPFKKDFMYKVVEEKITFTTLISLIELHFPTNWLLLMK